MASVDIGIRHYDYLVVSELFNIEIVAYAGAEGGYNGLELIVSVDLVRSRLLNVQHLAPHSQNGLEAGVAALVRAARGGISLDYIDLAEGGILLVAVLQLLGHTAGLEAGLVPDRLPRLSRRLSRSRRHHTLVDNGLRRLGVLLKENLKLLGDDSVNEGPYLGVSELLLRLPLELGVSQLDGDDGGKSLAAVVAGKLLIVLQKLVLRAVGVQRPRERRFEAGLVHTALGGQYVVREGYEHFAVPVVILHRYLGDGVLPAAGHIYYLLVERGLVLV